MSGIHSKTETLSLVSVSYDSNNLVSLNEGSVIYTKLRPEKYTDFCALRFSFSKKQLKKASLVSNYRAVLPNGVLCGEGELKLQSIENLRNKLNDINIKLENNFFLKKLTSSNSRAIALNKLDDVKKVLNENYIKEISLFELDYVDFLFLKNYEIVVLDFDLKNRAFDQKLFLFENCDAVFYNNSLSLSRIDLTKPIVLKINQTLEHNIFFSVRHKENLNLNFNISKGKEYVMLHL